MEPPELKLVGPAKDQPAPRHHSTRSKARKRALDLLFEADVRGLDPLALLAERSLESDTPPVREFSADLVEGVCTHRTAIDERIVAGLAPGWSLQRMPRVDRCLARIAVFELDYTDLAPQVAIAEAVALAEELSTDDSPAFLNGLLGTLHTSRPTPE